MSIIPIRLAPDPVLRLKAKRVKVIDNALKLLVEDMLDTMYNAGGVGLAAPQIGVPLRVVVIGVPDEKAVVLINPQILTKFGERVVNEGCLSIPGYVGEVKRAVTVTVKGKALNGKEVRITGDEMLAHALEHEIDHINGILYIDHLESPDKLKKLKPVKSKEQTENPDDSKIPA